MTTNEPTDPPGPPGDRTTLPDPQGRDGPGSRSSGNSAQPETTRKAGPPARRKTVAGMEKSREAKTGHSHVRPGWDCLACKAPWPCRVAQERLLEEFHSFPSVLTVYMTAQMYDALDDLVSIGQLVPANLFDRFIAWARKAAIDPDDPDRFDRTGDPKHDPRKAFAA